MQTITRTHVLNRWDTLPLPLKEALSEPAVGESVISIARAAHLDARRTAAFARLASYALMGFVDKDDMARELKESFELPGPTASAIVDELYRKVFAPLRNDIESVYKPTIREDGTEENEGIAIRKPELSTPDFPILHPAPRSTPSAPAPTSPPQSTTLPTGQAGAPFVLHEEKSLAPEVKKESMKGFALPFGLFKSKASEVSSAPRVTVEAPKKTPEAPKTVHYSEYRSNVAPGSGGEFINLETFGKTSVVPPAPTAASGKPVPPQAPPSSPPSAPPSAPPHIKPTQEKTSLATPLAIKKEGTAPSPKPPNGEAGKPKVQGNMVDLR